MSKQPYWEKRKVQDMFHYMEQAEKKAEELSQLYLKASRYLSLESEQIFEKYKTKHGLSDSEARRLLNMLQDKSSLEELKEALRSGKSDKAKEELLALLESAAYQARLERLKQLQNQLDLVMEQVYQQEKTVTTSHYVDLANEAYYRSIYRIQQQSGLAFSFNLIDPKMIDIVLDSKWSGENYSNRIWSNTNALAKDLKEELLFNLITGRTERETAEIIANKFAVGASKARRLVRTESCFISSQMDMEGYEECGLERYRFLATLDLVTSDICRSLDGKVFLVVKQMPGTNCPPMHPWCRSTTIAVIDNEELSELKRRARDPKTGKTYLLPADMTYKDWHSQYVKGNPEAELNEKMIRNRVPDKKQYSRYKKVLGKDAPDSLDSFQKMKYNEIENWKQLQQIYKDSNRYEKLVKEAGTLNIKGQPIKRIDRIDLTEYTFRDVHINIDREHMVTKELAQQYVSESVAAYRRWNGDVTVYISPSGATVVNHKDKAISTAYQSDEYDEKFNKLLEVLKVGKVSTREPGD